MPALPLTRHGRGAPGLALAAILLAGCASQPVEPVIDTAELLFDDARFGAAPAILPANEIYSLTEDQREAFLDWYEASHRRTDPPHRRVYDYLTDITRNFNYQGNTLTASEALRFQSGNCLSLANLTTALARVAGVDIAYELADNGPVFETRGSVISKGLHVRSLLFDPKWAPGGTFTTIGRPGLKVDYFPSRNERFVSNITDDEYTAMHYRNLAAESLAVDRLSDAYWYTRRSLEFAPDDPAAINTLAVIYRRDGDNARAEAIYRYGIETARDKVSLLRNYRILLTGQGRDAEARAISDQLAALDSPNPFDWLIVANAAYSEGDYQDALNMYRRASRIAPYLHEAHFGMAKAHYKLGNVKRARRSLNDALENAFRGATRAQYEAKLSALSGA